MNRNHLRIRSEHLRVFTFLGFFPATSCWPLLQKMYFFPHGERTPSGPRPFSLSRFHDQRHTTLGRTSLDRWSVRRRDHYLTTRNAHTGEKSMPSANPQSQQGSGGRPTPWIARPVRWAQKYILLEIIFTVLTDAILANFCLV